MKVVRRYHVVLVTLHWLLAAMILTNLVVGFAQLFMSNSNPDKITVLLLHMAGGTVILTLMAIRLIVRWRTAKPSPALTGKPFLNRMARLSHYGFYVLVVLMVATGFGIAIPADLPAIVFAGSGDSLPANFGAFPFFLVHFALGAMLVVLVAIHVFHGLLAPGRNEGPADEPDGVRQSSCG